MSPSYHANIELIAVDWLAAMRDHDLDRLRALLHPDVEQRWIDGEVYCANREQLLEWWSTRPARSEYRIDAVEVIGAGDRVVMAVRGPDLEWVGDENVGGQVCEVFTIRDGLVVAIRQYLGRSEALAAAGIDPSSAAWR
jgi:ketosteroid isomerase-like protein